MKLGIRTPPFLPILRGLGRAVRWLFFEEPRRRRAERVEERDWRRRLILASRMVQQAQLSLTNDLGDVRGVRDGLERSNEGLERLEAHVAKAEELFENLESRLDTHERNLQEGLELWNDMGSKNPHRYDMAPRHEKEIAELQIRIRALEAAQVEMQNRHAAEMQAVQAQAEQRVQAVETQAHLAPPSGSGPDVRDSGGSGRAAELAEEVTRLREVRAQLDVVHAHEIARVKRGFREKMKALEEQLEELKAQPAPAVEEDAGAAQKLQEKEVMLDLLQRRNAELERQVAEFMGQAGEDLPAGPGDLMGPLGLEAPCPEELEEQK